MSNEGESKLGNLKRSIMKTGFPLELEVDDILTSRGFFASPNSHYLDDETGKEREIDNHALLPHLSERMTKLDPIPFSPQVIVECKVLGDTSVVVFQRNRKVVTYYDFEGQMYDFPYLIEHRTRTTNMTTEFHLGWTLSNCGFHYSQFAPRIGIAKGLKPGGKVLEEDKEMKRDEVYSGLMQLIKAQVHDVKSSITRDKTISCPYYPFYFSFLALVVDGAIVEVHRKGGDLNLHAVDHAVVRTSFKPSYNEDFQGYLVDVVSHDYFSKYLSLLESDSDKICRAFEEDKFRVSKYMKRPSPPGTFY